MSDSITPLLQWLNAHPNLAGLATFVISAAESVAIIGTIIPGTVTMTAIGALMGAGVIPLWSTLIWAILGAIVGDNISYWMGYYFKDRLPLIWPFRNNPQILENGERFFYKYGTASVFIGRFVGPVRALVPLVAGMLRMPPLRFTIANVLSAIGWAPLYMFPGILLGAASLELPPDIAVHIILMFLLISLFIILCVWLTYKIFVLIHEQINQFLTWSWENLRHSRYFRVFTTLLKHHNPTKTSGQLALAFYLVVTSIAFLYLTTYVTNHHSAGIGINNAFFYLFRSFRHPFADNVMICITLLGDKKILVPTMLIITGWLAWKRHWHTAFHALALLVLSSGSTIALKHFIQSPRPWGVLKNSSSFSYPSGHATLSMVFFVGLGLLLLKLSKLPYKRSIYTIIGIMVITIGISRLYLGAHWFTDIIGGWLLASVLLMLVTLSYHRKSENKISAKGLFAVALATLTLIYGIVLYDSFGPLKTNYTQISWPTKTMSLQAWWQQNETDMPLYRIGRIGLPTQLLNLQWIGNLTEIKILLLAEGWNIPATRDWTNILHRLTDIDSAEHFPLVSPLYLDKAPALVLTKNMNGHKDLIVLRLWDSNIIIKGSVLPLWIGSVGVSPRTYSWIFNYKNSKDLVISPEVLFSTLPTQYDMKEVSITNKLKHKRRTQKILFIKPKNMA